METILQNVLSLLTIPPGNLVFHLVLAFSVLASLQAALIWRRASGYAQTGRLVFGLSILLVGQLGLFLSSGLAWQGLLNPHLFLPPLDRAITVFGLIWIVWLWSFPKPARLGDLVTGFLNLGVVILFIFTYTSWSAIGNDTAFNNAWTDWIWELAALFVVLTGMAILFFSRPPGWGFGIGMLSLSLAGTIAHLTLTPQDGDFSGLIRLSQLAAYPLLPTLLNRLATPAEAPAAAATGQAALKTPESLSADGQDAQLRKERRRYSSDPRTVHAWLELKEQTRSENVLAVMTKAIAHTMLSDMCFLVSTPVYGQVILQCGYDLVREDVIPGAALDQGQIPQIAAALQRGKSLRYGTEESQNADMRAVSSALGLKDAGSLMILPVIHDEKPIGGFLLLSPYSNRQWTIDDQNYLASESGRIAQILYSAQNQVESQPEQPQEDDRLIAQQAEIDRLRNEVQMLSDDLAEARRTSLSAAASPDINALIALQQESQEAITALQAENERLKTTPHSQRKGGLSVDESERLEADLRATLQEMAHLQNELAKANAAVLIFERQTPASNLQSTEDREVIAAITQEIRQPMSSILGYTDLLLAESVGILGALQRKFLERIRASTERMRSMLDDLIQVASTGGSLELLPKPVELGTIIDGAMEDTSGQLREKKITLRVDLPADLPRIYADRDAIQQIVVHLLQNAGTVTPQDGTITLRSKVEKQNDESYLLLQVTDTGGGVQPEFLARVFNRRYRADKPLIQGLGDAGIGLSIAKTLVEAHGGRIWVDTEQGQTTTFSILLPLRPEPVGTAVE